MEEKRVNQLARSNFVERNIQEQLFSMAESDYQKFSASLLPGVNNILGVRLPKLRKLAKQIAKEDWCEYFKATQAKNKQNEYFEEIMLQGMVIGYMDTDVETIVTYISDFLPKVDNWSVCDSFCIGLKFTKQNMEQVWDFLQQYFYSEAEYEVRFVVVMLLNFYIDQVHVERVLIILDKVNHSGYYVKMAVAWAISICYIKFPILTMDYLKNNHLDDFTYNKSLQKITESLKIDRDTKIIIKNMKRKISK